MAGSLADRFGLVIFVVILAVVQSVGTLTCGWANWPAQLVCTVTLVLFMTQIMLFINRYLLMYSPPNRYGTVQGVYTLIVMFVAMPITYGSLTVTEMLPNGPNAYRVPMWVMGGVGSVVLFMYAVYFKKHPPPEVPPLLPEDEAELARNFGCNNLDEVMLVTHETDKSRLVRMLASTDPEDTENLIRRLDTEKMAELMAQRPIEDVAEVVEKGGVGDEEDEEEEEDTALPATTSSPLLQEVKTEAPSAEDNSAIAEGASTPAKGGKIEALNDKYVSIINSQDKAGLRTYMLEENVDDMWEVQLYMEGKYSKAELDRMEKAFSKMLPGNQFAKILRQRPELRTLVQKMMKREMDKKVAWARGKKA